MTSTTAYPRVRLLYVATKPAKRYPRAAPAPDGPGYLATCTP